MALNILDWNIIMTIFTILAFIFIAIPALYVIFFDKSRYAFYFPIVLGVASLASLSMLVLNGVVE